ncbi:MAG: acylphosphatase [Chloroflexota bacterium]|nr:acylphosphatase [Chloroflexota bacterium]
MTSLKALVHGHVQGVFFRGFVAGWAEKLGLTGYVRNLPNGTVEVLAEGDRARLEELVKHLKEGPPAAKVDRVATGWSAYTGNYRGFQVR